LDHDGLGGRIETHLRGTALGGRRVDQILGRTTKALEKMRVIRVNNRAASLEIR
jgi:hypothetical protein